MGIDRFCLSLLFLGFSRQEYWSGLPFSSPVGHVLSELTTMTRPPWVALHPRDWLHKRLTQTCPWVSKSLQQGRGSAVTCCRVRGIEWGSSAQDFLKEVAIIFITSTIVWLQVKQQGGNTALPINKNWIKDLLSMVLPIRIRPSFPFSWLPWWLRW